MDTARGPLMPMPTTVMAVMEDMAAMVATDTARGPPMPMPTTATVVMEDMAAMAMVDTAMASNQAKSVQLSELSFPLHHTHRNLYDKLLKLIKIDKLLRILKFQT